MVGEGAVVAAVEVIPALTSLYTTAVITIAATTTTIRVVHILKHIRNGVTFKCLVVEYVCSHQDNEFDWIHRQVAMTLRLSTNMIGHWITQSQ